MTAVVEVRFKGNRKEYFAWGADQPPAVESPVIVEVERGQDLGRVSAVGEAASTKCTRCGACGAAGAPTAAATPPARRILRPATREDLARAEQLRTAEDDVRRLRRLTRA